MDPLCGAGLLMVLPVLFMLVLLRWARRRARRSGLNRKDVQDFVKWKKQRGKER